LPPSSQVGLGASKAELACDQILLRLPAARLCAAGDSLSLLWLQPGKPVWAILEETVPSGKPFILLDGLVWAPPLPRVRMQVLTTAPISPPQLPTSAYQFRLRLSLRGIDPFQAAAQDDAILLGPPTGPLLTDGAALSAQLSPAAMPPQPLPTSSSSAVPPH
jgi:hypothetical protein